MNEKHRSVQGTFRPAPGLRLPISLVIITLNESQNIGRCIQSVPFVSEVLVVDSGSTDATVSIAQNLGARVVTLPWQGFGKQKKKAAELAQYDWILSLDADEALSPDLQAEIIERFEDVSQNQVGRFNRRSQYLGQWIYHGGWYPDRQLRLFHRLHHQWNEAEIHEKIETQNVYPFRSPMDHYVFPNIHEHVATNNRYSGLLAQADYQKGRRFSWARLLLKPFSKFFETYFLKRGFLDGYPGFLIAVGASYSIFLRVAKLRELDRFNKMDKAGSTKAK